MGKFLFLTKNKKASILPVTVIATFIMMIIAYVCIKMFMAQNIMVTQDQIKVRTRYAAEGFAKMQVSAIYSLIKDINDPDKNIQITDNTAFSDTGIIHLIKDGDDYSIDFTSKLIPSGTNLNSAPFSSADTIFPDITLSASSVLPMNPQDWLSDCGVEFYKNNGVPDANVASLNYNNYMEINGDVYPDIGDEDPRIIENKRINDGCGEDLGYNYISFQVYPNYTASNSNDPIGRTYNEENCFWRYKLKSGDSLIRDFLQNLVRNTVRPKVFQQFNNVSKASVTSWHERYYIKNIRKGYVITTKARSSEISNKIPPVECTIKIYFDIFMTKLYKKAESLCAVSSWYAEGHYGYYNVYRDGSLYGAETRGSVVKYTVIPDIYKYISNIKFHIQKWEVVS